MSTLLLNSLGMATLDRERVLFIVALEEPPSSSTVALIGSQFVLSLNEK